LQRVQLDFGAGRHRSGVVDRRTQLGALFGDPGQCLDRCTVLHDHVSCGAAATDGANWWQRMWSVTLPMMRNIIAITALFSLIVTFANFDIVRILTAGGPLDQTHLFATWAFKIGIQGSDIPLGASISLFMAPILAIAAVFILRDINKRGNEA